MFCSKNNICAYHLIYEHQLLYISIFPLVFLFYSSEPASVHCSDFSIGDRDRAVLVRTRRAKWYNQAISHPYFWSWKVYPRSRCNLQCDKWIWWQIVDCNWKIITCYRLFHQSKQCLLKTKETVHYFIVNINFWRDM